jgi:hypothetical protein
LACFSSTQSPSAARFGIAGAEKLPSGGTSACNIKHAEGMLGAWLDIAKLWELVSLEVKTTGFLVCYVLIAVDSTWFDLVCLVVGRSLGSSREVWLVES